jgi:multisubunit Na+/H+ antiporter MnhB subunit
MPLTDKDKRRNAGLLQTAARLLLVPGFLIAIGNTLKGYVDIGDGFSGGVIAGLVVLLQGLAFGADELDRIPIARYAPVLSFAGLALALSTAFGPLLFGEELFSHWPPINEDVVHFGILEFITPVLFDIGVFLVVYGFAVGAVTAVARAEVRQARLRERARQQRRHDVEGAIHVDSTEVRP